MSPAILIYVGILFNLKYSIMLLLSVNILTFYCWQIIDVYTLSDDVISLLPGPVLKPYLLQ